MQSTLFYSEEEWEQYYLMLDAEQQKEDISFAIKKIKEEILKDLSNKDIASAKEILSEVENFFVSKENSSNIFDDTIVFTQVGLYDHEAYTSLSEEYIPKIFLYSDGTFDFICNYYEGIETLSGWWRLEENVPKTYHCSVENYPYIKNLDFYIYHNEASVATRLYLDK